MTTWPGLIPNADVAFGAKVSTGLLTTIRDQIEALAEGDPSLPVGLRNTVVLAEADLAGAGTTLTISGLDLTPFSMLLCGLISCRPNATADVFIAGKDMGQASGSVGSTGWLWVDLINSRVIDTERRLVTDSSTSPPNHVVSLSQASTSVNFSTAGSTTWNSGTAYLLGIK